MKPVLLFFLSFEVILQITQFNVAGENTTDRVTSTSTEPQWLKTLRANISRSVQHYGYQDAGPHIRRMVEDAENSSNLLLRVKGTSSVEFRPLLRSKHRKTVTESELSLQAPPWLEELQTFVKSIVQFFGKDKVLQMLEPTIKVIQETYDVKIADVDIDQYGNVQIAFVYNDESMPAER
ncbi:uncharacterized protein LOC120634322 isoform X3 [Pararge aegeria]|uniref:uncharacterized protein LOC120634322 isoform X3 n=1 Tax=Pararge aegeria TaxID=116150 RepID=UPI0019D11E7D|nr:uncharacterized protein LOC120634322 isoform X3 [Pararge aegeria]